MKRRMIGAWLALMITASSLVVSASPAADMSSVSADPQQEQTEPEEEEEAPDIPVTDQPGEAEMPVPTALPEPETVEEAFEEGKDNTENTDSDELIEPEEEPEAASKEGENIALTEIPEQTEDPGFTVFTEENAEILTGESEEDQELIQDIENGEIIALSASSPELPGKCCRTSRGVPGSWQCGSNLRRRGCYRSYSTFPVPVLSGQLDQGLLR